MTGGGGGGYESEDLSASVGANAVGGKTYFSSDEILEFSVEADGASSGTYKNLMYTGYGMPYQEGKNGTYSWNETTQTITLKPERVAVRLSGVIYDSFESKAEYRVSLLAKLNEQKEQMGEERFNQYFSTWGFSSDNEFIDYMVAEEFTKETHNYAFSTDEAVLFLDRVLPANKGSNQLAGQTYNGRDYDEDYNYTKNLERVYTFTGYAYTHTDAEHPINNNSGTYAYDGTQKRFWLKPSTADRQTEYEALVGSSDHWTVDETAEVINQRYKVKQYTYNTTDKTTIQLR